MYNTIGSFDVAIIGGGTSGAIAAITALKEGLSVVIVEKSIALCGTMTNAMVTPMMPSHVKNTAQVREMQNLIETYDQYDLRQGQTSFWFNPETVKYVFEREIINLGGTILYDAVLTDIVLAGNKIESIAAQVMNHKYCIQASQYIDCSGDAALARLSGITVQSGAEDTGINQSVSFRFEIGGIDIPTLREWCKTQEYTFNDCSNDRFFEFVHVPNNKSCGNLLTIFEEGVASGELDASDIRYIQGFSIPTKKGVLSFNGPQLPNEHKVTTPEGFSKYISIGRMMQRRLFKFLQKNIPGFTDAYIGQEASALGIRESYRIVGKYMLNEADYIARRKFPDGVVGADWYVDVHTDDLSVEDESFKVKYDKGEYYEIPYRSMVTNEISNYIAAGRHISTSFKVQSSIRIQLTCQDMGVVAALACSYGKTHGIPLNEIDGEKLKETIKY